MKATEDQIKFCVNILRTSIKITSLNWFNDTMFRGVAVNIFELWRFRMQNGCTAAQNKLSNNIATIQKAGLITSKKISNYNGWTRAKVNIAPTLQNELQQLCPDLLKELILNKDAENTNLLIEILKGIISEL